MSSQIPITEQVNPLSNSEPKSEQGDLNVRVEAMWEQMNKGLPNQTVKSLSNKSTSSTMNSSSQKPNDNWMKYLGLANKETGSSAQDARQKGSGAEDEKVAAFWEQMNKGVPKVKAKFCVSGSSATAEKSSPKKSEDWMGYLGLPNKKTEVSENKCVPNEPSSAQSGISEEAKKLAAAALSAVKDATAAAVGRGKVEITQVRDFAGKEIEYKKLVDAESKEAVAMTKPPTTSAVDTVLEQIKKKQKLSVLDKTKQDWGEYKENTGVEEELDAYKRSSNQYLDKVSFLQRADYREFERERDARLAQQARRRPADMREDL